MPATESRSGAATARTAVVLVQLGTPEAPEPGAVRRYLAEFLADRRVVELPPALWAPVLHGFVLRTRPKASAERYRQIWGADGSPLLAISRRQASLLKGALGERGLHVRVALAMRYGKPSIRSVLERLRADGLDRLLIIPLYPQFAAATTATVFDEVARILADWRDLPDLRFVRGFHDDPRWLDCLADSVRRHRDREGRADRLVMSFHGLPQRAVDRGDPYRRECEATAAGLAARLGLGADAWTMTFQSRLGRGKWLEPATEPTLVGLARQGVAEVDVVFPGFVADNLETLEEIAIGARDAFTGAGGRSLRVVPCANDSAAFTTMLADLAERNLAGWPCRRPAA